MTNRQFNLFAFLMVGVLLFALMAACVFEDRAKERAYNDGRHAGGRGESVATCPYTTTTTRERWLTGWVEGYTGRNK